MGLQSCVLTVALAWLSPSWWRFVADRGPILPQEHPLGGVTAVTVAPPVNQRLFACRREFLEPSQGAWSTASPLHLDTCLSLPPCSVPGLKHIPHSNQGGDKECSQERGNLMGR